MSLAIFCTGNFHQLWNHLGSNSTVKFFRLGSRWIPYKSLDAGISELQQLAQGKVRWATQTSVTPYSRSSWKREEEKIRSLKIIGKYAGSSANKDTASKLEKLTDKPSTNKITNQPELHELKAIHCYNVQGGTSIRKSIDRPATILVFDIETTGFGSETHRIIEIAIRDLIGGRDSTFQTLVNPERDVGNAEIHGICNEMVKRPEVPTFRELIPILLQYVESRRIAGRPVLWIAHNGRCFDVRFIIKEFQRCSMGIPADWMFVDTLPIARQLVKPDGSKLGARTLTALREHYKIQIVGREHRAMQDVNTLCYVLQRITFDLKLTVHQLMDKAFLASDIIKIPPSEEKNGA